MRIPTSWRRLPTLDEKFAPKANSVNFLRLVLAFSVLVGHAGILGLGKGNFGLRQTFGQADLGALGVDGFFVLSGFLITASGARFSLPRFAWHRFLRIFPGLWACLTVTALVIAPAVALHERHTLAGFWSHPQGPWQYMYANWFTGLRQFGVSGLLSTTPYGRFTGGASVFDGSLWSLSYELCCYFLVGALGVTAVLKRAPRAVVLLTALGYAVIVADYSSQPGLRSGPVEHGELGPFWLIGGLDGRYLIYLGFLFLLGASAQLYKHRLPIHRGIAVVAAIVLVVSMRFGGFFVLGLPAYGYLLLWAGCELPKWTHRIGRKNDYSYGIYIYAFPVQQVLAGSGGLKYGVGGYIVLSALGTMLFAVPSWHLIEHPAMSLKHWTPGWPRRAKDDVPAPEPAASQAEPELVG